MDVAPIFFFLSLGAVQELTNSSPVLLFLAPQESLLVKPPSIQSSSPPPAPRTNIQFEKKNPREDCLNNVRLQKQRMIKEQKTSTGKLRPLTV